MKFPAVMGAGSRPSREISQFSRLVEGALGQVDGRHTEHAQRCEDKRQGRERERYHQLHRGWRFQGKDVTCLSSDLRSGNRTCPVGLTFFPCCCADLCSSIYLPRHKEFRHCQKEDLTKRYFEQNIHLLYGL